MLCRMEMVELHEGFDGETTFPYTPVELAAALTQMINKDPEQGQAVPKDELQEIEDKGEIELNDLLQE